MKDLDKKTNDELSTIREGLGTNFEVVKQELVRLYDHWQDIEVMFNEVNKELRKRGIS